MILGPEKFAPESRCLQAIVLPRTILKETLIHPLPNQTVSLQRVMVTSTEVRRPVSRHPEAPCNSHCSLSRSSLSLLAGMMERTDSSADSAPRIHRSRALIKNRYSDDYLAFLLACWAA